ncbi:class I glutamine amidotransferase-like protein, partial [Dendryphion nanum]
MRVSTLMPIIAALPSVFGAPKQPALKNGTAIPKHYGILAFPTFQPLDVFGPVDVLQSFSMLYNQSGMHLSVISANMDPVNSASKKTARMNMTHSSFGSSISVTDTMKQVLANGGKCGGTPMPAHPGHPASNTLDDIEVLIVPGGGGTRENLTEEIAFVKTMYPKVKYVISVCTGSTILARAGILDGKKATSNKRAWTWAISTGPKVDWVGEARWTQDGKIWTSSGIAAGIDATYAWIGHLVGNDVADYLAMSAEYERVTDPNHDPFAKIWDVP